MPYIITVTKVTTTTEQYDEWVRMRDKPDEKGDQYGYAPARPREVTKTEEVFKQTVDDLVLLDVINAVNGVLP